MKKFDFYEFAAILCPGALLVLALARLMPQLAFLANKDSYSFGDLGIFVILSYIAGELVQALGDVIAKVWWKFWCGLPTDWVRSGKRELLAPQQAAQLPAKLLELTGITAPHGVTRFSQDDWYGITRQVYAVILHARRSSRVDIFNAYYGMFRGLTASLLLVIVASVIERGCLHPRLYALLIGAFILALFRMHRFGVNYARELFVQFLTTQKDEKPLPPVKEE